MTQPPLPETWQTLLAGYVLDDLSSDEMETFKQLLEADPSLTEEIQHYQEALSLLPYALPDQTPPPHLRSSIFNAIEASSKTAAAPHPNPTRPLIPLWLTLIGSAIALIAMALGADNYRLRQANHRLNHENSRLIAENSQLQQEVKQSRTVVAALEQPNTQIYKLVGATDSTAAASLVISPSQHVAIVARNLPKLVNDQAYRLWAIQTGVTQPTYCGQFNASGTEVTTTTWAAPTKVCSSVVDQMLITAESITAPPTPAGPLVLKSTKSL
jgi:anti-sigma-K factor RskA